jgi:hypothetical protein
MFEQALKAGNQSPTVSDTVFSKRQSAALQNGKPLTIYSPLTSVLLSVHTPVLTSEFQHIVVPSILRTHSRKVFTDSQGSRAPLVII